MLYVLVSRFLVYLVAIEEYTCTYDPWTLRFMLEKKLFDR